MNFTQSKFESLIDLLLKNEKEGSIISECLNNIENELTFSYSEGKRNPNKQELLVTYRTRAKIQSEVNKDNEFVLGYGKLLESLINCDFDIISNLTMEEGSFIIFSDYNFQKFIGILKSKRTLNEVRNKMNGYEQYYREMVFRNKILVE